MTSPNPATGEVVPLLPARTGRIAATVDDLALELAQRRQALSAVIARLDAEVSGDEDASMKGLSERARHLAHTLETAERELGRLTTRLRAPRRHSDLD